MTMMPDMDSIEIKFSQREADYMKQLQDMQTELQAKGTEYQQNVSKYSELMRQQKEKEINEGNRAMQEFQQIAMQDLQQYQGTLLQPVYDKILAAVKKVCAAQGIHFVMGIGNEPFLYYDPSKVTVITDAVKSELGL